MADKKDAVKQPTIETFVQWYEDWENATADNRKLQHRDLEYYHGKQWTSEEVSILRSRNQPVVTFNRIARKMNFLLGEEVRKRIDPVARPRTPQHEDGSIAITDALRYIDDAEGFDMLCGEVFRDLNIPGFGGAVVEVEIDEDDIEIKLRHAPWDRLYWDTHSVKADFSDAKYKGIVSWFDIDDAIEKYPDMEDALREALGTSQFGTYGGAMDDKPTRWIDPKRKRVQVCEVYYRIGKNWYVAHHTRSTLLVKPQPVGYVDGKRRPRICPLVMTSCYVDNDNNRYGNVRNMISAQDEINKRRSKSLHLLSVNQIAYERNAVLDAKLLQQERAKPDGVMMFEPDALMQGRVQFPSGAELSAGHAQMAMEAKAEIDSLGPASANVQTTAVSSGREFIARQSAASQELEPVFANFRAWRKEIFVHVWYCIRQFWTDEKWLRVTDDKELNGFRFVALNRAMTRAQRFKELLDKGRDMEAAFRVSAGEDAPQIMSEVQQQHQMMMAQQQQQQQMQAQAMMMRAAQQMRAQGMPPEQMQAALQQMSGQAAPPQPSEEDMQQHIAALIMQHPAMRAHMIDNKVDDIEVDIIIDEAPDTAVIEQEEFESLSQLAPVIVQARPDLGPQVMRLIVKASQLRSKRELLQDMDKGPEPQQLQAKQAAEQMQAQQGQALLRRTLADASAQEAKAQKTMAEIQAVPSRAKRDEAQAMHLAASAGDIVGSGGGAPMQPDPTVQF